MLSSVNNFAFQIHRFIDLKNVIAQDINIPAILAINILNLFVKNEITDHNKPGT